MLSIAKFRRFLFQINDMKKSFSFRFLVRDIAVGSRAGHFVALGFMLPTLAFISGCEKPAVTASPPNVEFVVVAADDVPVYREWVGTLAGDVNATITA